MSPSEAMKPVIIGEFSVRIDGLWAGTALQEAKAWALFLQERRGGRCVELLRGSKVVARIATQIEREIVLQ